MQERIKHKGQQNFSSNIDQHTYLTVTRTNNLNDLTKNLRQLFPIAFVILINDKDHLIKKYDSEERKEHDQINQVTKFV